MIPVSGLSADRVQQLPAAAETKSAQPKEEACPASQKPVTDEYIPEEKQEPSGRYWLERDEDGNPQIHFDDPGQPEKAPETIRGSTDEVDREIENLKKEKQKLEQQLSRETGETARQDLEHRLSQIKNELRQKDNDAYRRQHTVFS